MGDSGVTLSSLFKAEARDEAGVRSLYCRLDDTNLDQAAYRVALGLVDRRVGMNPRLRACWLKQHASPESEVATDSDRSLFEGGLLQNIGTRLNPSPAEHLHGLVAEEVWQQLIGELDFGLGKLLRVEGHDWSATDPGGDGLTVYAAGENEFSFRLWESKYHGTAAPIHQTVNTACLQVKKNAVSYLSRFAVFSQRVEDDAILASFMGRLPEMWVDKDPAGGVGVVVASNAGTYSACFDSMPNYFDLPASRHQGQLNMIGDFPAFALRVREILWKGCGLSNAH